MFISLQQTPRNQIRQSLALRLRDPMSGTVWF